MSRSISLYVIRDNEPVFLSGYVATVLHAAPWALPCGVLSDPALDVMEARMIQVQPVLDATTRALCRRPYPGHPKGCPMWGCKDGCPPQARVLQRVLDLSRPVYLVCNRFDLAAHVRAMRAKHPGWSYRQLVCVLYWQPRARKQLRAKVKAALAEHPELQVLYCPEAAGVNVTETMRAIGVVLEWPPTHYTYQVAILGTPLAP